MKDRQREHATPESASPNDLPKLLEAVAKIAWVALALVTLVLFYKPLRNDVLPHLTSVKIGDFEASFVAEQLHDITLGKCPHPDTATPPLITDKARLLLARRAK